MVQINGEVNSPGIYKYYDNYRLNKYIEIAGGLNANADNKQIWITHPDGTSYRKKQFSLFSPKVYDGSIITIAFKDPGRGSP